MNKLYAPLTYTIFTFETQSQSLEPQSHDSISPELRHFRSLGTHLSGPWARILSFFHTDITYGSVHAKFCMPGFELRFGSLKVKACRERSEFRERECYLACNHKQRMVRLQWDPILTPLCASRQWRTIPRSECQSCTGLWYVVKRGEEVSPAWTQSDTVLRIRARGGIPKIWAVQGRWWWTQHAQLDDCLARLRPMGVKYTIYLDVMQW